VDEDKNITGRPAWARPDLFPAAKEDSWGYVVGGQGAARVNDLEQLRDALRTDDNEMIGLVWTPARTHMDVPEAVPELLDAVKESRLKSSQRNLYKQNGQLRLGLFLLVAFIGYTGWQLIAWRGGFAPKLFFRDLWGTAAPAMGLLLFLMFFLMPWYEARKRWREVCSWTVETMRETGDLARFDVWLGSQKIHATRLLMGIIAVAGAVQVISGRVLAAALVKGSDGERWRLLTAPLLHGHPVHFIMNALALMYLGRRMEALVRWPQVPIVFLYSAWIGGECSLLLGHGNSLGASGGLMGMLGFLLVFETRHAGLVPRGSRRRLMAGLIGTAVIGLVGVQFIDNAAHAGGVIAGMIYAFVVFPRSESVMRPQVAAMDRWMAVFCFGLLAYGLLVAIRVMMGV
jgi:membrane associated rhomboid family serine protease